MTVRGSVFGCSAIMSPVVCNRCFIAAVEQVFYRKPERTRPSAKDATMKSPFPGMDPYIEARGLWEDFHSHLIEKIYDVLADEVPPNYVVRTTERSYVSLVEPEGKE